ncbi:uncharacterized protein LOC131901812 [Peromyscus eremicus]|uniref:uncharacterized protein LOC131901812 n=1 Tax=Peromyscus eremicus TaxID=42410 RepID=UPI0027DE1903|nr:uncharacterized protein LOC131901812 [Peromyscus eremicus]
MEQKDKVDVPGWPSNLESNMENKTGAPLGIEPGFRGPADQRGRGHSCGARIQVRAVEQKDKVDVPGWPSNTESNMENKIGAPLGIEPGLRGPADQHGRGHSCGARIQVRAVEQKDKVDVPGWPSNSESNMESKTGAPLGIEPGLRGPEDQRGRGHSCGARIQVRAVEQRDKVDVPGWPSNSESNMENKTGAPLGIERGLRGPEDQRGRGHSCGARTQARTMEQKDKVYIHCWPPNSECNIGKKTGAPWGMEQGLRGPASHRGRGHSCGARTQARTMEQKDKVYIHCKPSTLESNMGNKTGAPLGFEAGLRGPADQRGRGHSCGARIQVRAVEQKDKVDVPGWPSTSECTMESKTGAPLGMEQGLRGPADHRGRGHSCGARTQARSTEQKDKVDVPCWPSTSESIMENKTRAPLETESGLRGPADHRGRGHSCARTQARTTGQKDKVSVPPGWPSTSECNVGNKTGAPLGVEPGLRGPASHRGRGHSCARTQARTVEQKDKVDVPVWPSTSECNPENQPGAPLGIEPGHRGPADQRGRGHSCGTGTKAREHSEALPALGSEKKVHGALLKRKQIRLPRATGAVAHKPLWQGKKSSAKRGHTGKENTVCQPEVLPFTSPQEESSQGPPLFCWTPAVSSPPYVTMTLGQQLIVSPSVELHEAVASSNS